MKPHILLVEDDAGLRQMLTWELEDLGYRVTPAGSCGQAREKVDTQPFDAALLDYCLPDGNGIDLLTNFGTLVPGLPVILYSAQAGTETRERAWRLGAQHFLTKPVSVATVDRVLRRVIDRHIA